MEEPSTNHFPMSGEPASMLLEGMQPEPMQQPNAEGQRKHYFDSIDTDEFVMPNQFEVEIRLADN